MYKGEDEAQMRALFVGCHVTPVPIYNIFFTRGGSYVHSWFGVLTSHYFATGHRQLLCNIMDCLTPRLLLTAREGFSSCPLQNDDGSSFSFHHLINRFKKKKHGVFINA